MPIYEYVCRGCGERFERMRSMSERLSAPECGSCGGKQTSLALSVPGRVGGGSVEAPPTGPCGMAAAACCGGGRCMH
jgi:putative FmdB family regulatory protein